MDFGRQRGFYLMERTDLRRWAVERRVLFWSSCVLMLPGVVVVFHILLDGAKRSYNHRDCCCFELPNSLNLYFQVFLFVTSSFSVVLTEVLVSRGIVKSICQWEGRFYPSCSLAQRSAYQLRWSCQCGWASPSEWWRYPSRWCSYHLPSPQCQTLCRSSSACVQLPCRSGQLETRWSMVSSKRHTVYILGPRQASWVCCVVTSVQYNTIQ